MESEEFLIQEYGRQRHFRVPQGYFDNLGSQIMSRLPEPTARVVELRPSARLRKYIAIAACLVGVACLTGTYLSSSTPAGQPGMAAQPASFLSASAGSDEFNQIADYLMIDEDDMYAYLADE